MHLSLSLFNHDRHRRRATRRMHICLLFLRGCVAFPLLNPITLPTRSRTLWHTRYIPPVTYLVVYPRDEIRWRRFPDTRIWRSHCEIHGGKDIHAWCTMWGARDIITTSWHLYANADTKAEMMMLGTVMATHTRHILPFQPILWNRCFPSEPVKTAQNSPSSISEGVRLWQVCDSKGHRSGSSNQSGKGHDEGQGRRSGRLGVTHIYIYIYIYICIHTHVCMYVCM